MAAYVIGLDFGSDSGRSVVVNASTGEILSSSVMYYPRWMQGLYCNPNINQWRQHPKDYLEVLEFIVKDVLGKCPEDVAPNVVGIAFDTTGSTPVFTDESGTPLSLLPEFAENPNAMFALWKDHTGMKETAEINEACAKSDVDYLMFEGGTYSAEFFWAKTIHMLREAPEVANKAYGVVEHCEWLPALLTGVKHYKNIARSRCAWGHKAMWSEKWGGFPPKEFFAQIDPVAAKLHDMLFTQTMTADKPIGTLCPEWAEKFGLSTSVTVACGSFDAHVGAVGAGVKPHTLVSIIGTSTCDVMVASHDEVGGRCIRGICGQVDGSVIPGMIGLEAGQSSFGDVYAMFRRVLEWPLRNLSGLSGDALEKACDGIIPALTAEAEKVPVSESTMIATDWINGRRSPDTNQLVQGTISGFRLGTTAPQIFRALVEATAFGTKAIIDKLVSEGIRFDEVIGIGGIALKNPFVMQTMSDVIGMPIKVCNTDQACALGAAMFAATAAGIYDKVEDAIAAMNSGFAKEYYPDAGNTAAYAEIYKKYLALGKFTEENLYSESTQKARICLKKECRNSAMC